jgi:CheY-like chemotaxis protein
MPRGIVLVVDDDDVLRLLAATVLADAGYEVVTASCGAPQRRRRAGQSAEIARAAPQRADPA